MFKDESDESLINLNSLQVMGINHKDFPLPIDRKLKESTEKGRLVNNEDKRNPTKLDDILKRHGSMRISLKFHEVDEDNINIDRELSNYKEKGPKEIPQSIQRGVRDRLKIDPMKLELIDDY